MDIQRWLLIAIFAGVSNAGATVLTFDITGAADGSFVPQAYGDRVISTTNGAFSYGLGGGITPSIVTDYVPADSSSDLSFWTTGFNDLANVVYNQPHDGTGFTIRLTADPGSMVRLDSFDLGNFGGAVTLGLRVEDGQGNSLFSMSNVPVGDSSQPHQHYDFSSGLIASEINIVVDTTGLNGHSDNIGLDNIQFGQVPEPTTCALLLLGAALWVTTHRKRQIAKHFAG